MSEETPSQMKILCPSCGRKLDVSALPAFSDVSCPQCGAIIRIPYWFTSSILLEDELFYGEDLCIYRSLEPSLDREAVVKVVTLGQRFSPEALARFLDAARKQSLISDKSIAAIYGCGMKGDTIAYVVSQYAAKRTWPAAPLKDLHQFCELAISILSALNTAAASGLYHGGLSPSNILFTATDDVLITDFGVSYALGTAPGRYASPARQAGCPPKAEDDVYSVALCLYELATGCFPSSQGAPVPVAQLNSAIPKNISDCLQAMLSTDAARRPDKYALLIDEFATGLQGASNKKTFTNASPTKGTAPAKGGGPTKLSMKPGAAKPAAPRTAKGSASSGSNTFLKILLIFALLALAAVGAMFLFKDKLPFLKAKAPVQQAANAPKDAGKAEAAAPAAPASAQSDPQDPQAVECAPLAYAVPDNIKKFRPRPDNLDFVSVKENIKNYLGLLPAEMLEPEKDKIRLMGSSLDYLNACMKFGPYDRGENTKILLRNGKFIRGIIPRAPNKDGELYIRSPKGEDRTIKMNEIKFTQIIDMFQYYAEKRVEMAPGKKLPADVKEEVYEAYKLIAVLCEWYDMPAEAAGYVAKSLQYRPSKGEELLKLGLPVPSRYILKKAK